MSLDIMDATDQEEQPRRGNRVRKSVDKFQPTQGTSLDSDLFGSSFVPFATRGEPYTITTDHVQAKSVDSTRATKIRALKNLKKKKPDLEGKSRETNPPKQK